MAFLAALGPALGAAAPYVALATTAVQAVNQYQQGKQQQAEMKIEARRDEADANAAEAASQRQALQERRRARLLRSRALAVAGKSGAGVDDPTIDNLLAGIDNEGEMNYLNALYEGQTLAAGLRSNASTRRRMGSASRRAGRSEAIITGLSGAQSFYSRYG